MAVNNIDLSAQAVPSTTAVTLTNANQCYQITLPRTCVAVILSPIAKAAYVGYTASDALGNNKHPISTASSAEWPLFPTKDPKNLPRICLQTADAGTVVTVTLLPRNGIFAE